MKTSIRCLILYLMVATGSSHAGLISFDFRETGIQTYPNPVRFNEQNIELIITAEATSVDALLYQDNDGLGIKLVSGSDGSEIDLSGPDESLSLQFNQNIQLMSAAFSQVGNNDDFILSMIGASVIRADIPGGNDTDSDTGIYDFSLMNLLASNFSFAADSQYSEYSLAQITIHHVVPSPTSSLLLLLGLASLLWFHTSPHRNKRKATRDGSEITADI